MAIRGRGKRGGDVAGDIRAAFIRAVKAREPENVHHHNKTTKPLSTIMDELLDENPIGLLNAMKGFVPKEVDAHIEATELSYEQWLESIEDDDQAEDER